MIEQSNEHTDVPADVVVPVPGQSRTSFLYGISWAAVTSLISMYIAPLNHDGYMLIFAVPLYVGAAIIVPLVAYFLGRRAFARGAFLVLPISIILWLVVLFRFM